MFSPFFSDLFFSLFVQELFILSQTNISIFRSQIISKSNIFSVYPLTNDRELTDRPEIKQLSKYIKSMLRSPTSKGSRASEYQVN